MDSRRTRSGLWNYGITKAKESLVVTVTAVQVMVGFSVAKTVTVTVQELLFGGSAAS